MANFRFKYSYLPFVIFMTYADLSMGQLTTIDNSNFIAALDEWLADPSAATTKYGPIGEWDTSSVTDMAEAFGIAAGKNFNDDISGWDTSQVTTMRRMFYGVTEFNQNIGNWDVSNVGDMESMFEGATSFNQDLSKWNVANVQIFWKTFMGASSFNSNLAAWDVSSGFDFEQMFDSASSFTSDLSNWEVSNAVYLGYMFADAKAFNSDLSSWGGKLSNVRTAYGIFLGATSFTSDLSSWKFDTNYATDLSEMFLGATSFSSDLSGWDVSTVEAFTGMFFGASQFNSDLSGWNVQAATDMKSMFHGASSFNSDLSSWTMTNVNNMTSMFEDATLFNSDLSSWDTSNVIRFDRMFHNAITFNSDISSWDVSKGINFDNMFNGASSFSQQLPWQLPAGSTSNNMFLGTNSASLDNPDGSNVQPTVMPIPQPTNAPPVPTVSQLTSAPNTPIPTPQPTNAPTFSPNVPQLTSIPFTPEMPRNQETTPSPTSASTSAPGPQPVVSFTIPPFHVTVVVPSETVNNRRLATIDEIAQDIDDVFTSLLTEEIQKCIGCNPPVTVDLTVTYVAPSRARQLQEGPRNVKNYSTPTARRRAQSSSDVSLTFRVEGTGTGGNCAFATTDQQARYHVNDLMQDVLNDNQKVTNSLKTIGTTPSLKNATKVMTEFPLQSSCNDNPEDAFVIEFGQRKNCAWLSCDSRSQLIYCQKPYYVTTICPHTCAGRCSKDTSCTN